jgi:esterase/lipase
MKGISSRILSTMPVALSTLSDKQGAEKVILAGASLGGLASAKLAIESNASGLIIFASPIEIARWDFKIEAEDLNIDIPKFF